MQIIQCENNGVSGWKCGEDGKCHIGIEAKQRAFRDAAEIKAEEFRKNPAPLPKKAIAKKSKIK